MDKYIKEYLNKYDLDVRKTGDARFMDQKVTPDVMGIIADCVLQYVGSDDSKEFTTKDIWDSLYANETIKDIFNKPDVLNKQAKSEYDKFFAQPLKMFAYSHVLNCVKRGNKNIFTIQNRDILEYISIKERNALNFLVIYLEKVLKDSGLWNLFEKFLNINVKDNFDLLKDGFRNFLYENTKIKSTNKYEPGRIFPKIINPICYINKKLGTKGGIISKDVIGYDELMYNRKNWKDVDKLKDETRQEYEIRAKEQVQKIKNAYVKHTVEKAKRLIKERYQGISEINDEFSNGQATETHHIFSEAEYPKIKSFLENLILLTPTQHRNKAHLNGNFNRVDRGYQLLCLLSKSDSIEESINVNDGFYSKDDFVFVLNTGIDPIDKFSIGRSIFDIKEKLVHEYHSS